MGAVLASLFWFSFHRGSAYLGLPLQILMTPSTIFVPMIWLLLKPLSSFEVHLPKDKCRHRASLDEITPFSSSEVLFHLFTTEINRNRIGRSEKKKKKILPPSVTRIFQIELLNSHYHLTKNIPHTGLPILS